MLYTPFLHESLQLLSWTRITNNFINVFNVVTSPRVFSNRFVLLDADQMHHKTFNEGMIVV